MLILRNSMRPYDGDNATVREMFLKGMTEIWLYSLDTFGANFSSADVQFLNNAAYRSFQTFSELQRFWPEYFAVLLYEGQTFLVTNITWM